SLCRSQPEQWPGRILCLSNGHCACNYGGKAGGACQIICLSCMDFMHPAISNPARKRGIN
ncbi:MAG: hypothetical protein RIS11_565, partial [Pseudomonadota bacterium]